VTERLIILVTVLIAAGVLAWLPGVGRLLVSPLRALRALVGWFDQRLNRLDRTAANRATRGAIVVALVASFAAAIGAFLAPLGLPVEAITLAVLLDAPALAAARKASHGLDATRESDYAVARGAIERLAESFAGGIVGAAFWYLLLGLPGLAAARAIDVAAARIGATSPRYAAFGRAARLAERLVQLVPAPTAGMLIALAAIFAPRAHPLRAVATMLRDAGNASGGWTLGAVAGALGLSLGGPRQYPDATVAGPWIGDGRARATASDVTAAVYLIAVATLLTAGILGAMALGRLSAA
jgi:adenosylcobinamide-phosphate synthase